MHALKTKQKAIAWDPSQPSSSIAKRERWLKRYRELSALIESGQNLAQMARELKLTRERVRQLAKMMGLRTERSRRAERRRRKPTTSELKKIRLLYHKGISANKIAIEFDMNPLSLKSTLARLKPFAEFRCLRCGRRFISPDRRIRKYCPECSPIHKHEIAAEYMRRRYRTDPEFRKRILANKWERVRREEAAGKKWNKEEHKKLREMHAKKPAPGLRRRK